METKETKALEYFRSGLNCAQSVLKAFTDSMHADESLLLGVSVGFGGGMGRLQETCGAVTGACMVIGIHNSEKFTDNSEMKEASYAMIQKFSNQFKTLNGATDCKTLLNCDLKKSEVRQYAHDHHLFEKVCEKCISDSTKIVEEMIDIYQ